MTHPHRDRWKEIIGPEYDLMVKRYLSFVNELKKTAQETRLILPEHVQGKLNNADGNLRVIPEEGIKGLLSSPALTQELSSIISMLSIFDNFGERLKNEPKTVNNDLISIAEKLPEASRSFYMQYLDVPEKVEKQFRNYLVSMGKSKRDKFIKKMIKFYPSLVGGLMFQYMFQELDRCLDKITEKQDLLDNADHLLTIMSLINSLLSQMAFQSTIKELLLKGNDESLLRVVRIDKKLVDHDILRARIAKAHSSADTKFLTRLINNLTYHPLEKEAMYYEAYIVLRTFWKAGLNMLKPKDMDCFLTACGIIHPPIPETMKKTLIVRHIYPLFGK